MKRKGRTNAANKVPEEKPENGVDESNDTNGDYNDADEKKKRTPAGRSGAKAAKKNDDEGDSDAESSDEFVEEEQTNKRKSSGKNKDEEDDDSSEEDDDIEKSPSKKKKTGKHSKADSDDASDDEAKDKKKRKKSANKGKAKKTKAELKEQDDGDEEQYEVEKVIAEKAIRGVKHYLIRWKGYNSDSDTWEPHNTVDCPNLIAQFKKQQKKTKGRPSKPLKKRGPTEEEWDENEDFEVDKIIDVHFKKDGKREFLVSWKGYSTADSSWEPEENMNCIDLIQKFMSKVDKAKESTEKELRVNRKHTDRFTLTMGATGRRLSKRQVGKQRVQYHDAE